MSKFTQGDWVIDNSGYFTGIRSKDDYGTKRICTFKTDIAIANVHLMVAAPCMYKSLERQRTGLINLIDLNLITESQIESVRHEISLIDNELSRARGD